MNKKQIWLIIFILGIAIIFKIPYLYEQAVAFDFDHGRDALAVIHMIKTGQLRFIGPWTSIPGLFFGALYYYLLVPLAWLTSGHPLSQTWTMFILVIIQVWLAFKYFGFWEAIILATTPAWTTLATGSSNSFPMPLVTWLILINLLPVLKNKTTSIKQMFWLGVFLSLGFHFSSALAIFLIPAVLLILIKNKVKLNLKQITFGVLGFGLVFLPQILFEIKHNFMEVKAVMEYLKYGEKNSLSLSKIGYIINQVWSELVLASLPETNIKIIEVSLVSFGLIWMIVKKINFKYWFEFSLFLLIPIIGFTRLHYNPWYVSGLFPVAVLIVAQIIKNSPKTIKIMFFSLLLLTPILGLHRFYTESRETYQKGRVFYKNKLKVVKYIYSQSNSNSFSVYTYAPAIYDYAWQYLFFWQGFQEKQLPVEFSYKPGEVSYIKEKLDLLSLFPVLEKSPEKVFLVVNLPDNKHQYPLENWLDSIKIKKVFQKTKITEELWVWEVSLKQN